MKKNSKKDKASNPWLPLIGLLLILAIICVVLFFLMQGNTTITQGESDSESTYSVVCESDSIEYSMFDYNYSDSKSLNINAVFNDDGLKAVSVIYKLGIVDDDALTYSEARNHALMNKSFYNDGLGPDSFDAKYGKLENELQFSLYARADELNSKTLKYVMLDKLGTNKKLVEDKIVEAYISQGLNCKTNNK